MKNNKGMTLVELVVVISIIAVLAIMSFPVMQNWTERSRLRKATRDIYFNLQKTRMNAVKSGKSWDVVFEVGSNQYKMRDADNTTSTTISLNSERYRGATLGSGVSTGIPNQNLRSMYSGLPSDGVRFCKINNGIKIESNTIRFRSDGIAVMVASDGSSIGTPSGYGEIYLKRSNGETYAVEMVLATGAAKLWKNFGNKWED